MTGADDWYGERIEDQARHSVVTEARSYDDGQQRPSMESASVGESVSSVRQRPAVDNVYSGSTRPQMYATLRSGSTQKFWGSIAPSAPSSPSPFYPFFETDKIRTPYRPTFFQLAFESGATSESGGTRLPAPK